MLFLRETKIQHKYKNTTYHTEKVQLQKHLYDRIEKIIFSIKYFSQCSTDRHDAVPPALLGSTMNSVFCL